jgi:hypothetical protein
MHIIKPVWLTHGGTELDRCDSLLSRDGDTLHNGADSNQFTDGPYVLMPIL